jgi:hypothetical protein
VIWQELHQKSVNISALASWILNQVPNLDSTQTLVTSNDDLMSKSLPKKPPKWTEVENDII